MFSLCGTGSGFFLVRIGLILPETAAERLNSAEIIKLDDSIKKVITLYQRNILLIEILKFPWIISKLKPKGLIYPESWSSTFV